MSRVDRRRKSVLIVECDSLKLARQNLALGNDLYSFLRRVFPRNPIDLIQVDKKADLLEKVRKLDEMEMQYRSIIIIGHSDQSGLQLASDGSAHWDGVANWFKSFDPHRIILIACRAGRWLPCAALFNGIPNLKEVFGSPVLAHKDEGYAVLVLVSHILGAQRVEQDWIRLIQAGNFLMNKGLIFRRTRREYETDGNAEGLIWHLTEPILEEIINGLRLS